MTKRKVTQPSPDEQLILRTTEVIYEAMERNGITKAELARRLGATNAHVTQILSGDRNLTLRTIAAVASALELSARVILIDSDALDDAGPASSPDI